MDTIEYFGKKILRTSRRQNLIKKELYPKNGGRHRVGIKERFIDALRNSAASLNQNERGKIKSPDLCLRTLKNLRGRVTARSGSPGAGQSRDKRDNKADVTEGGVQILADEFLTSKS